jgi:hypothetical protein
MKQDEQVRQEFEKWMKDHPWPTSVDGTGEYTSKTTLLAWKAWRARCGPTRSRTGRKGEAVKTRCAAWDGQQCRTTTNLTSCALRVQQGTILKSPVGVVVPLCGKHFQLDIKKRKAADEPDGRGP